MEKKERKDALRQYQRYLKLQKGFTANTLDAYLRDVQKLLIYLKDEQKAPWWSEAKKAVFGAITSIFKDEETALTVPLILPQIEFIHSMGVLCSLEYF